MVAPAPLAEYLREFRLQVCSHCIERLPGGPPCTHLGKVCALELHLPKLIDAIRQVHSGLMAPYAETTECVVCQGCAFRGGTDCPCPMHYLLPLAVEAVESVDESHGAPAE